MSHNFETRLLLAIDLGKRVSHRKISEYTIPRLNINRNTVSFIFAYVQFVFADFNCFIFSVPFIVLSRPGNFHRSLLSRKPVSIFYAFKTSSFPFRNSSRIQISLSGAVRIFVFLPVSVCLCSLVDPSFEDILYLLDYFLYGVLLAVHFQYVLYGHSSRSVFINAGIPMALNLRSS